MLLCTAHFIQVLNLLTTSCFHSELVFTQILYKFEMKTKGNFTQLKKYFDSIFSSISQMVSTVQAAVHSFIKKQVLSYFSKQEMASSKCIILEEQKRSG